MTSIHGTSYRQTTDWRQRAACRDMGPDAFDLDVIHGDKEAIDKALGTCRSCPVLKDCQEEISRRPDSQKPRDLIQAGRVWTERVHQGRRALRRWPHTDEEAMKGHAEYVRMRARGVYIENIPAAVRDAERAYHAMVRRQKRQRGAA